MGYDVTFHPISLHDLRTYVFDVIEQPDVAGARVSEITSDPEKRRQIERIYGQLAKWIGQLSDGNSLPLNETFAYAVAQIAGALHPYWYSRNAAISMLDDDTVRGLFVPLTELPDAPVCIRRAKAAAHIGLNYTASGIITDLDRLEQNLARLGLDDKNDPPALFTVFDGIRLASLREAIAYCKQHNLALLEASDVVVPIAGESGTDPDNFREAEGFDPPSSTERQWFEQPAQARQPAFEALQAANELLSNDTVIVRRLFGRNRTATVVPLYLVPELDRRKYHHDKYVAAVYNNGLIQPVRRRSLKVLQRASSHGEYRRRNFEYERSFYEEQGEADPGPGIVSAQIRIGEIPQQILNVGLSAASVGEWKIANAIFDKALLASEIIIRDKHMERDTHSYPENVANLLRTQWFTLALMDQSLDSETLTEACETYYEFAKNLNRSQWDEYKQQNYVEFVLTSLVAGRPNLALEMLDLNRPFDDQSELVSVYRSIANAKRGSAAAKAILERCMRLLEVIRHPQGSTFLWHGGLTGIQLALVTDRYLAEKPAWESIRNIVDWLGH